MTSKESRRVPSFSGTHAWIGPARRNTVESPRSPLIDSWTATSPSLTEISVDDVGWVKFRQDSLKEAKANSYLRAADDDVPIVEVGFEGAMYGASGSDLEEEAEAEREEEQKERENREKADILSHTTTTEEFVAV
ncbi:uncharacterized protein N7459_004265 [Penicillium hispanicum]|uniref:uncharacterized protein n=1 Tax=Penicillium hispanicum TaxID=1080232 RepID=UPI0025411C7A|nr:uncharacterized protein N7459_004265 [Penicillium hispanicum]KAJ5584465.1 hypothetical protein N7459_004265 [Penicillium hispanicum]